MKRLALALSVFLAGCGTVYPLTADPSIPFAEGQVATTAKDDGTVEIDLTTLHIGDPGKLDPAATVYVVWVRPRGTGDGKAENVGSFKPTSELKGWMTFKTKHRDLDLFVTPEASPEVEAPTGRILLKGEIESGVPAAAPATAVPATEPTSAASTEAPASTDSTATEPPPAAPSANPPENPGQ
jgi:hypothetical protein